MAKRIDVILEFDAPQRAAFTHFAASVASSEDGEASAISLLDKVAGLGVEVPAASIPVPMMSAAPRLTPHRRSQLAAFADKEESPDVQSTTTVLEVSVPRNNLAKLEARRDVKVWPSSPLTLLDRRSTATLAAAEGIDCVHSSVATMDEVRSLLSIAPLWTKGLRGEGMIVAVVDEGIDGKTYPAKNGYDGPDAPKPGSAPVTSHGSMCAADILVCAPKAKLLDYPMLEGATSGTALRMYQHILDLKRRTGTPHLTNNSYGYVGVPPKNQFPTHEVHDLNHPFHRKVRELVATGTACFFAAGNCGANCPSGNCQPSGIGPGRSIHASNSLAEVITVAAVNKLSQRIGYSSQGPGMFFKQKPDIACFSHFYANFGPGRPGGGGTGNFDNGTSAATPLAAGLAALLIQAYPRVAPADLKTALTKTAWRSGAKGWDADIGHGIIDALAAWTYLSGRTARR